jgi:hypothetical protein
MCLGSFLFNTGLLPRYTLYSIYNNFYIPLSKMIVMICESIGSNGLSCAKRLVQCESMVFHHFNYTDPIYNAFTYVGSLLPTIDTGRPPSFKYSRSNVRSRKTSSGRHQASYFANKQLLRKRQIIIHPSKIQVKCGTPETGKMIVTHPFRKPPIMTTSSVPTMILHVLITPGMLPYLLTGQVE